MKGPRPNSPLPRMYYGYLRWEKRKHPVPAERATCLKTLQLVLLCRWDRKKNRAFRQFLLSGAETNVYNVEIIFQTIKILFEKESTEGFKEESDKPEKK